MLETDAAVKSNFFLNSSTFSVFSGRIEILDKLDKGFWKVSINGQEFKLFSDKELIAGSIIRATIKLVNNRLVLQNITKQENNNIKSPVFLINTSADLLVKNLQAAFIKTGLSISAFEFEIIKKLIQNREIRQKHLLPVLTDAVLKGFKNESQLLSILDSLNRGRDDNSSSGKKKKNPDSSKTVLKEIKSLISESEQTDSILFLYNHIQSSHSHWVIFPFALGQKDDETDGSVRLRFSPSGVLEKTVVHAQKKERIWFFSIVNNKDKNLFLKIYSNKIGRSALTGSKFDNLRKKLQNLGVIIDDNIYDVNIFDGFSESFSDNLDFSV